MHQALVINDLKKTYAGGVEALKGVSLQVKDGDFFALLGPNGAGKSTTIGILTGLVKKSAGSVSVYGHDIDTDPSAVKACLGVVPQEFNFNPFEGVLNTIIFQAGYYGISRREAMPRADIGRVRGALGLCAAASSAACWALCGAMASLPASRACRRWR